MNPNYSNARDLFTAVLELETNGERENFLDEIATHSPELAHRVRDLLKAHHEAERGRFFSANPRWSDRIHEDGVAHASGMEDAEGSRIGRFKLLQKIGVGGMGVVYMAEQEEPVRRKVALKIIKLGMDTKQVVARFEAERQALAMMDHPNIAKVLDAGATETGRPYFVMELVHGIRLTDYCDKNNLTTKERLDLFIKVCHAIQHAHQKGIIHRDIKPSNILVTLHDGVPSPKVIDFGVAKATQAELTEKTIFTQYGQFIGTPAYMSPEQAEMSGLDIDTRSDIYSLGVMLYELLTGKTPFDVKELMAAGLDAMRKTIREKEPVRPSTRLTDELITADVSPRKATPGLAIPAQEEVNAHLRRRLRLKEQIARVRGDLDWITMKCLEKDRTRRYETANGLAADLQCHLANEPVVARPPSAAYKFQKTWQRNKLPLGAAAALGLMLVVGVMVSTREAIVATRARAAAVAAEGLAQQARASEVEQRRKATEARDEALDHELQARRNLYVASMALAYQALNKGHLGRARELQRKAADAGTTGRGTDSLPGMQGADLRGWEWRYLWSQTRGDDLCILGRHDPMAQVALWVPDGARALSAGKDGLVKLWNVDGRRLINQTSFPDRVNGLAVSPDGTCFVAGLENGSLSLWDLSDFHRIWQVTLPHQVGHVAYSPDGEMIAIAGEDKVSVLASREGNLRRRVDQNGGLHYGFKRGLAFSPDSRWLAFGNGREPEVQLLNLESGAAEWLAMPEGDDVLTLAFSPDARYLAAGNRSTVTIWDWQARRIVQVFRLQHNSVCVAFSPDGTRLASANADHTIKLWDTRSWRETATLRGHEFEVWSVSFSPDSKQLISAAKDDTVRVWKTKPDSKSLDMSFPENMTLATSRDGTNSTLLALNHDTGGFITYGLFTGQRILEGRLESPMQKKSSAVELMPNQLVVGFPDGHLELFDLATQRRIWSVTNHARSVRELSGSAASGQIAVSYEDGRIDLLALRTGTAEQSLQTMPIRVDTIRSSLALSQDGKRLLAAAAFSRELPVWNLETGQVKHLRLKHREGLLTAAFSDDGEWIVTTSFDAFASLWEVDSGRELARFSGGFVGFRQAAISPDKTRVALYKYEGELSVWDSATEQPMATFATEAGEFPSVAWDPDMDCIATVTSSQFHLSRVPSWVEIEAAEAAEKRAQQP